MIFSKKRCIRNKKIKELRSGGATQQEVANYIHCSQPTVCRIEHDGFVYPKTFDTDTTRKVLYSN